MRKSNVALRLQPSLLEEARRVADNEGVALNQLINVAVAEKLSALRTEEYFRERADRADIKKAKRFRLKRRVRLLRRAILGSPADDAALVHVEAALTRMFVHLRRGHDAEPADPARGVAAQGFVDKAVVALHEAGGLDLAPLGKEILNQAGVRRARLARRRPV